MTNNGMRLKADTIRVETGMGLKLQDFKILNLKEVDAIGEDKSILIRSHNGTSILNSGLVQGTSIQLEFYQLEA